MRSYEGLTPFYGDLHTHCAVGYGHGTLEDLFRNARLQLDFAAATVHAHWPDMPVGDPRLAEVIDYHREGFARTAEAWPRVQHVAEAYHQPGRFVTFSGFEWHSSRYGDHNVVFKEPSGEIVRATSLQELREGLRRLRSEGTEGLVIPHHIGYRRGYRGIDWDAFSPAFSPVVEIMSMHGASDVPDAPFPYLHTMGPRDWRGTYQYGLAKGHVVGAIGSTDHHSAHPGSHGHGRMAVWAEDLTRDAIWDAIQARRTYALTGDAIALVFSVNGAPMGKVVPSSRARQVAVEVEAGHALDYVEVLHNNQILDRVSAYEGKRAARGSAYAAPLKTYVELGWGERGDDVGWQVDLDVVDGRLVGVEPRFRGHDVLAPQDSEEACYAFSHWERRGEHGVRFATRTWGNPTTTSSATQAFGLQIAGDAQTLIRGRVNGQVVEVSLGELVAGPRTGYLGGFLTPAYCFHRAVPEAEYVCRLEMEHLASAKGQDWYYVRVRQSNGQWAWSSPIWVSA